jgi:hypothetical protein
MLENSWNCSSGNMLCSILEQLSSVKASSREDLEIEGVPFDCTAI